MSNALTPANNPFIAQMRELVATPSPIDLVREFIDDWQDLAPICGKKADAPLPYDHLDDEELMDEVSKRLSDGFSPDAYIDREQFDELSGMVREALIRWEISIYGYY